MIVLQYHFYEIYFFKLNLNCVDLKKIETNKHLKIGMFTIITFKAQTVKGWLFTRKSFQGNSKSKREKISKLLTKSFEHLKYKQFFKNRIACFIH